MDFRDTAPPPFLEWGDSYLLTTLQWKWWTDEQSIFMRGLTSEREQLITFESKLVA